MYELRAKNYNSASKLIYIKGSKNVSLPILASLLLAPGLYNISNLGDYQDIQVMIDLLKQCQVVQTPDGIWDTRQLKIPSKIIQCEKIRASYYLMGSSLYLQQKISFDLPGGCQLGLVSRPIDQHIKFFEFMGCDINFADHSLTIDSHNYRIDFSGYFKFSQKSVGATVNAVLGSVRGQGQIRLDNVDLDPIVTELIKFLNQMGAKIDIKLESSQILIDRVMNLYSTDWKIIPDPLIAGSFIIFVALMPDPEQFTLGPILIPNLGQFYDLIKDLGIVLNRQGNHYYRISIQEPNPKSTIFKTNSFPGLYTDLQPFLALYLSLKGIKAQITDIIFPNRFNYVFELNKLGYSNFKIQDQTLIISEIPCDEDNLSETKIDRTVHITSCDLRSGMTMLIAACVALQKGDLDMITINQSHQIERGYSNVIEILKLFDIECLNKMEHVPKFIFPTGDNFPNIVFNYPLSELCSLKIGGYIRRLVCVKTYKTLIQTVLWCQRSHIPFRVIGDGTNIYFEDKVYEGLIIKNEIVEIQTLNPIPKDPNYLFYTVSSGVKLHDLVEYVAQFNGDLHQLSLIPGTLGGAIYGNVGAYGCEIKDILEKITVITDQGLIVNLAPSDLKFGYRQSGFQDLKYVIMSAVVKIPIGQINIIQDHIARITNLRLTKLPYNQATAGSFFKNINLIQGKIPTGKLIQDLNLKISPSPVTISPQHHNILVNKGSGSYLNLTQLVQTIQNEALNHYGLWLEPEVKCLLIKDFI